MTTNIISSSAKSRVAYVAETTFGTIPTTPTFLEVRRTNGNLSTKKTTVESDEIHLDRNVRAIYQTGQDVAGSYDVEFSSGSFDDMIAAALMSTWSTNVVGVGVTPPSFTFEETADIGNSNFAYNRFAGCMVNSLSLTVAARAALKGSIALMGQVETTDTAILSGATYTAPNTYAIETAATLAISAMFGLSPIATVKSLSLSIDNSLRIRDQVTSLYSNQFGVGLCKISGQIEAYFSDNTAYALSLSHSTGTLTFQIGTVSGKRYTVSIPNAQITDGMRKIGGRNDDIMVTIPFEATGNASSNSINITRAV